MHKASTSVTAANTGSREFEKMWCNMGPFRGQTKRVKASLFGNRKMKIGWPRSEKVGLNFDGPGSILEYVEALLIKSGFNSPDELRDIITIPGRLLTCRHLLDETARFINVKKSRPEKILRQALILGLCGPDLYDPNRPVIWTNSRLNRKLGLYESGDFYAGN